MGYIELPDEMFAAPQTGDAIPLPPVDPMVAREQQIADTTRAEQGLNQFLAAKQHMLFEAPDAFYRQQGEDAIHAAPVATQKLDQLRADLLDRLGNDAQRQRLSDALDAQMHITHENIDRHVSEQYLDWQRATARDRIAALTKEAALHHNDDELVDTMGEAAATAARVRDQVGGASADSTAGEAAEALARSGVFNAAILSRLGGKDLVAAARMLVRLKDRLDPAHAEVLQARLDAAQRLDAAKAYAEQVVPSEQPASAEEIEAQRAAVLQRAALDHADDPVRQMLAEHHINVGFDAHRTALDQGDADRTAAIQQWLTTRGADGKPQTAPPPAELWMRLDDEEKARVLQRLRENGRRLQSASVGETDADPNIVLARGEAVPAEPVAQDERPIPVDVQMAQANPARKPAPPATPPRGQQTEPATSAPPRAKTETPEEAQARAKRRTERQQEFQSWLQRKITPSPTEEQLLPEDWPKYLPDDTYIALIDSADALKIPRELLAAIFWKESKFREIAGKDSLASGKGLAGLTNIALRQLKINAVGNPEKLAELERADRYNGPESAKMAAEYLRYLYDKSGKSWPRAVAAYKEGETELSSWFAGDPSTHDWSLVKDYLARVFRGNPRRFD